MSKKDAALRYVWGALTVASEDIARAIDRSDAGTQDVLSEVFGLIADAQVKAEYLYLTMADDPDVPTRRQDTVYMAVPRDLEDQIRNTVSILSSSEDATDIFDAAAQEVRAILDIAKKNHSIGAGSIAVVERLSQRAKAIEELASQAKKRNYLDTIPKSELSRIREEVRREYDGKMLLAADRLNEMRDMLRAKRDAR